MNPESKAVVLLSGGIDSATTAAFARQQGFVVYALTFIYGQRHAVEVEAASLIAAHLGVREHRTITIDLRAFGGSALTDDIDVPKGRTQQAMGAGVPSTYVPELLCELLGLLCELLGDGWVMRDPHTPLIQASKAEIIRLGRTLGLDYRLTSSCYDPNHDGEACGQCDACILRLDAFATNGLPDPRMYQLVETG